MTSEVFLGWLKAFSERVTQRPLLLLLDGHLSHVSIDVIKLAMEKDITILKFPPHVTDVLQPLDVFCFGPLKKKWASLLSIRAGIIGSRGSLTKADFVDELASIWYECLTAENIKAALHQLVYILLKGQNIPFIDWIQGY